MTERRELIARIHNAIGKRHNGWGRTPLWGGLGDEWKIRPIDRLYGALVLAIGEADIEHAYATTDARAKPFTYELALWTRTHVIHAMGDDTEDWPLVDLVRRDSLQKLTVLRAPVERRDFHADATDVTSARLEYAAFVVEVEDWRGEWLPSAIVELAADL